jgi:hypothetical protein
MCKVSAHKQTTLGGNIVYCQQFRLFSNRINSLIDVILNRHFSLERSLYAFMRPNHLRNSVKTRYWKMIWARKFSNRALIFQALTGELRSR